MLNVNKMRGVAALPVTVGILLIVLVVGATITAISFSELFVSKTGKEAKIGFYDAESGIRDALLNIARNAYFEETNGYNPIGCDKFAIPEECIARGCAWNGSCKSLLTVWVIDDCIKYQEEEESCISAGCDWNGSSCDPKSCTDCPDGCNTYDGLECGTKNVYKIICSQMETPSPGIAKESVISVIKVVADVSKKGKITQCSWEQL